ncbi:unnamed protein product [Sphenostylis stenocarpa]|uniref:Uncharacterized protein n=1 Tax=Sphenostylis stenocarpa TaxID=92480 RepID=A0AA86SMM4_9FABA|nr:unnamed protein product [Sphenostylis stenocarpa]
MVKKPETRETNKRWHRKVNAHAPKYIEKSEQEEKCTKRSPLSPDAVVSEHQPQRKKSQIDEIGIELISERLKLRLGLRHSLFGENGNDFEEYELEKIAGECKNDAEDDLDEDAFLFVLFVEAMVQEPQTRPTQ